MNNKNTIPENYSPNFEENRKEFYQHVARVAKQKETSKKHHTSGKEPDVKRDQHKLQERK